jgi:hypothetical protein
VENIDKSFFASYSPLVAAHVLLRRGLNEASSKVTSTPVTSQRSGGGGGGHISGTPLLSRSPSRAPYFLSPSFGGITLMMGLSFGALGILLRDRSSSSIALRDPLAFLSRDLSEIRSLFLAIVFVVVTLILGTSHPLTVLTMRLVT